MLRSHLRMTGRWRLERRGATRIGRPWLVLRGAEREGVLWNGPVLELGGARGSAAVRRLGPDVLDEPLELDAIVRNLRATDQEREIGNALLDQRLVAGIGNMWKAEVLWEARVSPWAHVGDLADDELRACREDRGDPDACGVELPTIRPQRVPSPRVPALRRPDRVARAG